MGEIDFTNPAVQWLADIYTARATTAYDLTEPFADAVRTVFAIDPSGRRFEQVGSCVLITLNDYVFALSAAHVLEAVGPYPVPIGCGDTVHYLPGDRFSTRQGPSGTHADDPDDAAVFHIDGDIPDVIRGAALPVSSIISTTPSAETQFCAAIGYRVKKGKRTGKDWYSPQDTFVSIEMEVSEYEAAGIDPTRFVAMVYERDVITPSGKQQSPSPKGMSGGAIVRMEGIRANPSRTSADSPKPVLSATISECRKGKASIPQLIIGSRIGLHLGLIQQYLPDALAGLIDPHP